MISKITRRVVVSAFLVLALTTVGPDVQAKEETSDTYRLLELFGDVFERVRSDYVEEVSDEQLIESAIQGMLSHLDPHSSYLDQKGYKEVEVQTRGEFGGLGIEVTMENGLVKVVSPIDDTPAYRAGIQAGDVITHLDGEQVQGLTLSEAVERMRGPVDSDIKLTIRREEEEPFDVTITRDKITIRSVRSRAEGDIGYIRVTNFNKQTTSDVKASIRKLEGEIGEKLQGYILDLRNNPGGLLEQAIDVSDVFLDKGEIVSTRGRSKENAQRFHATSGDMIEGMPLVVLINGGSASASEIVAGALQDHRRAILLGTKSFGKGSVQTIIQMNRDIAIKLTTQRYYTPSGRSIQALGIDPDILVEQARLEKLETRRGRKERDLRGALDVKEESDTTKPAVTPESEGPESKDPDTESSDANQGATPVEDYQLTRAIDLIHGISLFEASRSVN